MSCFKAIFIVVLFASMIAGASMESSYLNQREKFLKKDSQNRNILSDLYRMQSGIKKLHQEKGKIQTKVEKAQKGIEGISPLVQKAESALLVQKIQIQKRLMYILKFQDMSFLKILFSSQTPSEMDRNLRILKGLTERDYVSLRGYFQNVKAIINKKKELLYKKKELDQLLVDLQKKEELLNSKTKEKAIVLSSLKKQQKDLLLNLKKMRENTQNLSDEKKEFLDVLFEPLFFERKGSLKKPVVGQYLQGYGVMEHPLYKTQLRHKGIFIGANKGENVKSVASGKVSYVSDLQGLGKTLILDHGDHYFSVYSQLKNIDLKVGDAVSEGQVVAQIGYPNPFFGEGLYFELRHFAEPVNPQEWFEGKSSEK